MKYIYILVHTLKLSSSLAQHVLGVGGGNVCTNEQTHVPDVGHAF
jgi:hypothetical protein